MSGKRTVQRIGHVARKSKVSVETIRFYEREGLIEQPSKPLRGQREYGEKQLAQLTYVRLGQELGLTLGDVRAIQSLATGERATFCGSVREMLAARLAKIEEQIETLRRKRESLNGWLAQCQARNAALQCPLYDQLQPLVQKLGRRRS